MMEKDAKNIRKSVDKIEEVDTEHLTLADLRSHYRTGRANTRGSGRDKISTYRNGIGTNIGDVEESLWRRLVKDLINKHDEQELHQQLRAWVKENCLWLKTEAEIELEALELHASRIFDDQEWVGFIPFNRQYRPKTLEQANIAHVTFFSCGHSGDVTQAQIDRADNQQVSCPVCGVWSEFQIIPSDDV